MLEYILGPLLAKTCPQHGFSNTFYPPPSTYLPARDIPDLSGKVAIVTGGNVGIGLETCKQLLLKNCRVYLAARSQAKAEEAIAELKRETGKATVFFLHLDLADMNSVKVSATEFVRKRESGWTCLARA